MLGSLALLLAVGLLAGKAVSMLCLPGLLGMLMVGILVGPYALDLLNPDLLHISQELRSLALIIILLRAGLGLKRKNLAQVGSAALRLSCIPCILEGITVMTLSHYLLGLTFAEAGMLGFIISAVSPAVVVPGMINLKEQGYGEDKQISTLILAGASVDDVFAITLFTSFLALGLQGQTNLWLELGRIPLSIGAGILGGFLVAMVLLKLYGYKPLVTRNTEKLLLLIAFAVFYFDIGEHIGIASLLGVMTIGLVILEKRKKSAVQFAVKLAKVWIFAQVILFTLVGAQVNIHVAIEAGLIGTLIIAMGLIGRSLGVWIATLGTNLNTKEKLFCIIAYMPKATVQAAIGALPLAAGIEAGSTILALAVLSILITAPLGAVGIKVGAPLLLHKDL